MDLVTINKSIPIKAIPEKELNRIIIEEFAPWLSALLSLTDEVSADRLEMALPAIKEHCWSMGFAEIKKMFENYADGKLSVKPMPNYFDRILLGKIVEAYKSQKPRKKTKPETIELSEEEKEVEVILGVMNLFEEYKQTKQIPAGYAYVYDYLKEKEKLPKHTKEFKAFILKRAERPPEQKEGMPPINMEEWKKSLENKQGSIKIRCKQIVLSDYFDGLIKNKIEIKEALKQ